MLGYFSNFYNNEGMMKKLCLVALCLVSFSMNSFACGCTKNNTTDSTNQQKCSCDDSKNQCGSDKCPAKSN